MPKEKIHSFLTASHQFCEVVFQKEKLACSSIEPPKPSQKPSKPSSNQYKTTRGSMTTHHLTINFFCRGGDPTSAQPEPPQITRRSRGRVCIDRALPSSHENHSHMLKQTLNKAMIRQSTMTHQSKNIINPSLDLLVLKNEAAELPGVCSLNQTFVSVSSLDVNFPFGKSKSFAEHVF